MSIIFILAIPSPRRKRCLVGSWMPDQVRSGMTFYMFGCRSNHIAAFCLYGAWPFHHGAQNAHSPLTSLSRFTFSTSAQPSRRPLRLRSTPAQPGRAARPGRNRWRRSGNRYLTLRRPIWSLLHAAVFSLTCMPALVARLTSISRLNLSHFPLIKSDILD